MGGEVSEKLPREAGLVLAWLPGFCTLPHADLATLRLQPKSRYATRGGVRYHLEVFRVYSPITADPLVLLSSLAILPLDSGWEH